MLRYPIQVYAICKMNSKHQVFHTGLTNSNAKLGRILISINIMMENSILGIWVSFVQWKIYCQLQTLLNSGLLTRLWIFSPQFLWTDCKIITFEQNVRMYTCLTKLWNCCQFTVVSFTRGLGNNYVYLNRTLGCGFTVYILLSCEYCLHKWNMKRTTRYMISVYLTSEKYLMITYQ